DPDDDGEDSLLGAEAVELNAGYMAVIVGDRPPQLFTFDLDMFYQTSTLVDGLALSNTPSIWSEETEDGTHTISVERPNNPDFSSGDTREGINNEASNNNAENERDPIALVREETRDGLQAQAGTLTTPFIDNPPFIYGAWQSNTVWQPLSQSAIATDGTDPTNILDELSEAADIQLPQNLDSDPLPIVIDTDVLDPPQPIDLEPIDPLLVGPQPDPFFPVGPIQNIIEPDPDVIVPAPAPEPDIIEPDPGVIVPAPAPEPDIIEPDPDPDVTSPDPDPDTMEPDPGIMEPDLDITPPDMDTNPFDPPADMDDMPDNGDDGPMPPDSDGNGGGLVEPDPSVGSP
ncbi:MAG: hypothetical protein F6K16_39655, partial [Symploca sp. SIO2B6]|nr:hypothetical protein [Symploca sp. SIO2B6]